MRYNAQVHAVTRRSRLRSTGKDREGPRHQHPGLDQGGHRTGMGPRKREQPSQRCQHSTQNNASQDLWYGFPKLVPLVRSNLLSRKKELVSRTAFTRPASPGALRRMVPMSPSQHVEPQESDPRSPFHSWDSPRSSPCSTSLRTILHNANISLLV